MDLVFMATAGTDLVAFLEMEIDATGVRSVVQPEVEDEKHLAQDPQAWTCKQSS